jgi:hypothetical protein
MFYSAFIRYFILFKKNELPTISSHQKLLCQQFLSAHRHPATAAVAAADFYSSLTRVIIKIYLIIILYQLFTVNTGNNLMFSNIN